MFKKYRISFIVELRPVEQKDLDSWKHNIGILTDENGCRIEVSNDDMLNLSPKLGDMIARNPDDHNDMWLVSEKDYELYYKEVEDGE